MNFKEIPVFDSYYASDCGKIKSLKKAGKEKILSQWFHKKSGYYYVTLSGGGKRGNFSVHSLVAMAFLGHIPCGFESEVDHINEIKTDNRLENLQILTHRENISRSKKNTTSKYRGVSWDKNTKKWYSKIRFEKRNVSLGFFDKEEDAHIAYENAFFSIKNKTYSPPAVRIPSSCFPGVHKCKNSGKWIANPTINKKRVRLGCFQTEQDAINAIKKVKPSK